MGATSKGSSAGNKQQKKKRKEKGLKYISDVDSKFQHNSNFLEFLKNFIRFK